MSDRDGNFLSRWSRLKQRSRAPAPAGREGSGADATASRPDDAGSRTPLPSGSDGAPPSRAPAGPDRIDETPTPAVPVPAGEAAPDDAQNDRAGTTLPPIESLRPDSDFRPFMRAGIGASTRNAALKRLFADPQFNMMDGLDVYIDDYGKTEPIPESLLRRLVREHSPDLLDARADEGAAPAAPPSGHDAATAAPASRPAPAEERLASGEDRVAPGEDQVAFDEHRLAPGDDPLAQDPDRAHGQREPQIAVDEPAAGLAPRRDDDPDVASDPCTREHRG